MTTTTGVGAGITLWLCSCCSSHGEARLEPETVTCLVCGLPCSCDGCVAEKDPDRFA